MYISDEESERINGYTMLIGTALKGVSPDYWRGPCGRIWLGIFERAFLDFDTLVPKDGYLNHCPDLMHNRVNDRKHLGRPRVSNGHEPASNLDVRVSYNPSGSSEEI